MNSGYPNENSTPSNWDKWLVQHSSGLLLFARQQARSESDAQDLVQEAILEQWRLARENPPPVARVYGTIRRRAIDWARSKDRRSVRETAAAGAVPACWFDTQPEDREAALLLQKAMKQIPPLYAEVITLKIWAGLTFAEISETLEIPASTAASRYRYGLEELRRITLEVLV